MTIMHLNNYLKNKFTRNRKRFEKTPAVITLNINLMLKKVAEITEIHLEIDKTDPANLIIHTNGKVDRKGWINAQLLPYTYFTPPLDGIYAFDFLGEASHSPKASTAVDIIAEPFTWHNFPADLVGIKVNSSTNHIMGFLSENKSTRPFLETAPFRKVETKELQNLKKTNAPFSITNAFIWEDILHMTVQYLGGCRRHSFQLLWDGTKVKSIPLQIHLTLFHDNNGDPCKSIVTEELTFALSDHIQNNAVLLLDRWTKDLVYEEEIVI